MTPALLILGLVTLQRLGELVLARRNTRRLLARGAHEVGAGHYPLIVALHASWLISLVELGWDQSVEPGWIALFLLFQLARVWIIASLGDRWTTRIVILPGAPPVRRGPYRYVAHPNYVVVAGEIAVLPLALGLPPLAAIFTVLNAAILAWRIRVENRALALA